MRVAVFRAEADGRRTAARLADHGREAVLAPVFHIVPTGATVPVGTADALVFTSAHAPAALAGHTEGIAHLRNLPCWCVGARTAAAARAAGFQSISAGSGDAAGLAQMIAARGAMRLTLVVGRDRKPDLEQDLAQAGIMLDVVEAYAAEAVPRWSVATVASLADITNALHYSRRSADLAYRLAETSGLTEVFGSWMHHCLSDNVASLLREHGITRLTVAHHPDETSLLASLP